MGEYITYKNQEYKIGTCENLTDVTFQKYVDAYYGGWLSKCDGGTYPASYLQPDSGNRFRFPFPDEDRLPFGCITGDLMRTVPVLITGWDIDCNEPLGTRPTDPYIIGIVQQRLVHRQADGKLVLALVYESSKSTKLKRMEDDQHVKYLVSQIIRHHITGEPDPEKKKFYRKLASRILQGYRFTPTEQMLRTFYRNLPHIVPPTKNTPGL